MEYIDFLKQKEITAVSCGFEPTRTDERLFDWQSEK